jgi:hypothetical protein
MAQIKIYGLAEHLNPMKATVSDAIHGCVVEALQFPADKRAHRFFPMDRADFYIPGGQGRTDRYTIIEISMFEGRYRRRKEAADPLAVRTSAGERRYRPGRHRDHDYRNAGDRTGASAGRRATRLRSTTGSTSDRFQRVAELNV